MTQTAAQGHPAGSRPSHSHAHGQTHSSQPHPGEHAPDLSGPPTDVMDLLKRETWDLHQQAERAERQRALVKGEMDAAAYAEHLGRLLLVHKALEARLRDAAKAEPAIAAVVTERQYQVPYLIADLQHLGASTDPATPAELENLLAQIADASPLRLLGMHYVLEGSNNGGRYIAMAVRKHLASHLGSNGEGTRYLDPYGEEQRTLWAAFKAAMIAQGFTPAQEQELLAGAKAMFRGLTDAMNAPAAV